jgi:large subunit ribosomal protein L4e
MQIPVYSLTGTEKGKITLARPFSEPVRPDLIKRAVLAERSRLRQPYGSDPIAGMRTSAHYHGRRRYRYSMMNREMARMKRIHGGGFLSYRARAVPQAVKGRKAHPPKVEKVWEKRINRKEWLKALYSAISATAKEDIVWARSHDIKGIKNIPLVVEDRLQEMKKTSEIKNALKKLGLGRELERTAQTKTRAGRGKTRGRKTIRRKGPLIIISEDRGIGKAARNIPGVEVVRLGELSVDMLAPGTVLGRLAIWTKSAVEMLAKTAK